MRPVGSLRRGLLFVGIAGVLGVVCGGAVESDVLSPRPGLWRTVVSDGETTMTTEMCSTTEEEDVWRLLNPALREG